MEYEKGSKAAWRRRLTARTQAGQSHLLLNLMRSIFGKVTENHDGLDPALPWRRLGVHGRRLTHLRSALGDSLGVELSATVFFDHPTPAALAEHLRLRLLDLRSAEVTGLVRGQAALFHARGGRTVVPLTRLVQRPHLRCEARHVLRYTFL